MKFNCGLTSEEKRALRAERANNICKEGQVVFAWFPVRVGSGDCRWLEKVCRRPDKEYYSGIHGGSDFIRHFSNGSDLHWVYEAIQPK